MELREAATGDIDGIRTAARESLVASYGHAVDEEILEESIERWYNADELSRDLEGGNAAFVVAVEDDDVAGFAQSYVVERRESVGEIDWLHVAPEYRGAGLGTRLLARVERALLDRGVDRIEGRVLEANEAGAGFYESHGYERTGESYVEVGGERFAEEVYTKLPEEGEATQVVLEQQFTPDGTTVYVAYDEEERASRGPFFASYLDSDREERYGWFCSNCGGFDAAMDSMGRIECSNCGNRKRPTRWDSAYL